MSYPVDLTLLLSTPRVLETQTLWNAAVLFTGQLLFLSHNQQQLSMSK